MNDYNHIIQPVARKKRTVIVYLGIFFQYLEIINNKKRYIRILTKAMAKSTVQHKEGCTCSKGYTHHLSRTRTPRNFRGERYEVPIWQIRCLECGAVFTILPSFLARYQRNDTDCMSKLLEINLIMTSSYRHTLKILEYAHGEQLAWNPKRMLHIVNWLGDLLPLPCILMRLGLTPPETILEDEKFVRENGEKTYSVFIFCEEVIWWTDYLNQTDETKLEASFRSYLSKVREIYANYNIKAATYDGWEAAKKAFKAINQSIVIQECHFHAKARMRRALPIIERENSTFTRDQLQEIKQRHDQILDADTRASYSQRLRRFKETFGHITQVAKRCLSLKNKLKMFLAYLFFPVLCLPKVSTSLDQLIKFFARKFRIMQTFRNASSADKTVRAFAIVRNFWRYMPGAKREGMSPVEIAGANLQGISWLEVVNLATTSDITPAEHVAILYDT